MSDQGPPPPNPPGHQPNWGSAYPPPPPPQSPPGYQAYYPPAKHPQAVTAMVLGILGLALCGLLAPFAWSIGATAVKEIDANPAAYSGRGEANAGKIMGIVGTCLIIVSIVAVVGLFSFGLALGAASS